MSASRFPKCPPLRVKRSVRRPSFRTLSTQTSEEASSSGSQSPAHVLSPIAQQSHDSAHIRTSLILNRSPFLTRTPSRFERAYYVYQQGIQRALHNPFPYEFYFKQGSLLEAKFNAEERRRERSAFGAPFGLIENKEGEENKKQSMNESVAEAMGKEEEESIPRQGEADKKKDIRSLDRKGHRNLYLLLLKRVNDRQLWQFPEGVLEKGELLHEAAERNLLAECGINMDTWIVSRNPIGLYRPASPSLQPGSAELNPRVFFFKAHILSGQVRPDGTNVLDFAWLTKRELERRTEKDYWLGVKDMLSDF